MSLLAIILIIILICALFGGGYGYYNRTPGTPWPQQPYSGFYYGGGIIWLVLLIVLIAILAGRL